MPADRLAPVEIVTRVAKVEALELVVRQQTQRLPDGGFRARSFPGSRQLLADAAAREQRLGSNIETTSVARTPRASALSARQGPALRGQVGDTASAIATMPGCMAPASPGGGAAPGRHGGKIHACIAGLPQDGRDIFN